MKLCAVFDNWSLFILVFLVIVPQHNLSACTFWNITSSKTVFFNETPEIICYRPSVLKPQFLILWKSVQFLFSGGENDYHVCQGASKKEVEDHCIRSVPFWSRYLLHWDNQELKSLSILPFNETCVLLEGTSPVVVELQIQDFDVVIFARLISGILLFFLASKLSRNVFFYYGSGIAVGVLASTLILTYLLSRFIPKGAAVGLLAVSLSATAYVIRRSWQEFVLFAVLHTEYIICYCLLSGLLTFSILYYKGPISNPRFFDIFKWIIQLFALILIYSGTQISVVSGTIVILTILAHLTPVYSFGLGRKFKSFWRRMFPPKIRLLTEEEYLEQAEVETRKALEELRSFCRSPNCHAWKTVTRLKSPTRFAQWVDSDFDHIQENESVEHDFNPSPNLPRDFDIDDE